MIKTRNTMPTTYDALLEYMINQRNPYTATLCNNTVAHLGGNIMAPAIIKITLHGHNIVQLRSDGGVRVRHCGCVTTTTQDRIKRFLPEGWTCSRIKGIMLVENVGKWAPLAEYVDDQLWTAWLYSDDSGMIPRSHD